MPGGRRHSPEEFKDEGDRVVVSAHFTGKDKSGAELDAHSELIYEMQDGKVVRCGNKVDQAAEPPAGADRRQREFGGGPR